MAPLRDFRRLVDGAALVALEAARRSSAAEAARSGGVQAVLSAALKRAVVTTTDIAGITRGRPLEVSSPQPQDSVVYFHDTPDSAPASASSLGGGAQPSDRHSSEPMPRESIVYFESPAAASGSGLEASQPHGGAVDKDQELDIRIKEEKRELGNLGGDREGKDPSLDFPREGEQKGPVFDARREEDNSGGGGDDAGTIQMKRRRPRERRVPSTPIGRAIGFAGLGAGLVWGTIQESAKRIIFGMPQSDNKQSISSPFLSEQNAKRFALALCKMRGAALKVGQMLSIQDESLVPVPILAALDIVRQGADVMPRRQLDAVLDAELGPDWSSKLRSFDYEPLAAASIGQVHRAVLKDGLEVAMKIQYPGVADSIESDIENVRRLLEYTNIIPKGLFLDRAIKVAKEELSRECDYVLEAVNQRRFRELISNLEGFYIPMVIDDISSRKVLTTEFVRGIPIDKVALLNQETRNYVGRKLLELTLKELFVFRFMQTDPNWGNFLYDEPIRMINLIDFGAAREYPQKFVDDYLRMVVACANRDRLAVIEMSQRLGFLTGEENEVMLDAHVQAGFIVGLPFSKPGGFDFCMNNITPSVTNLGATMLKHRLTPPPDEAYSLHRKLSGAFLACIKLGAVVSCRELLFEVYRQHCFSDDNTEVLSSSVA